MCICCRSWCRGGLGWDASFLGIRPPADPKGPLCTILRCPFLAMDPKKFLKMPWAPIYTSFWGRARQKNAIFWSKHFKKCLKTPFWHVFKNFACGTKQCGTKQNWDKAVLGKSSKNQFDLGRPKKRSTKFSKFFGKSAILEKILDPPLICRFCNALKVHCSHFRKKWPNFCARVGFSPYSFRPFHYSFLTSFSTVKNISIFWAPNEKKTFHLWSVFLKHNLKHQFFLEEYKGNIMLRMDWRWMVMRRRKENRRWVYSRRWKVTTSKCRW